METANLIGRQQNLFAEDFERYSDAIDDAIRGRRILVYGGAGSIGREVVRQCFLRKPSALHVMDVSENNLVELVRDLRSSLGYISGDTQFLPIAMADVESRAFLKSQPRYDLVFNLAAMKHVRSEKDEFSLMRLTRTNVLDTLRTLDLATSCATGKYFAVSTDKAKNPANLMGATKRIMEDILFSSDGATPVSTARFANVAFSDGSLLHGFTQRLSRKQPISAPRDVRRYFVTGEESGMLCLAAATLGEHRQIFFPNLNADTHLLTFSEIAVRFLAYHGYEPVEVGSEEEARSRASEFIARKQWPCHFFESNTSGEKPFEEFFSGEDDVDWNRFTGIGVIEVPPLTQATKDGAFHFVSEVERLTSKGTWTKTELVQLIYDACPDLQHAETGTYLDNKM